MKTCAISIIFLGITFACFGQPEPYNLTGVTSKKVSLSKNTGELSNIDAGKSITIIDFLKDATLNLAYIINYEGSKYKISASDLKRITFETPTNKAALWNLVRINSNLDANLVSKGYQYDLRKELEDETIDLLQNFDKYYGFFNDEYLEDFIQGLLNGIHPITLDDKRPGNLVIRILKTSSPNAFCTPTGTIIITTGLLSTIRSEDELIGVLSHEVAHFVLDHQVVNINKAIDRQKRADFWTAFAASAAAVTEGYLSYKYEVPMTGNLTLATAILSNSIATSLNERLGTNYNIEQEYEADQAAVMILNYLNKDPKAFSAALTRIKDYCILNGDFLALSGSGTHPGIGNRIAKIGLTDPNQYNSKSYDRIISNIITYNALNEYGLKHLETALNLTNRNIDAEVATEADYLLKAMTIRIMNNTPEKNQESLDLIIKAKTLNVVPLTYTYKQEGITLIRLSKQKEAIEAFKTYLIKLEAEREIDKSTYLNDEIEWTKKMIFKTGLL